MSDNPDPISGFKFALQFDTDPVAAFTECDLPSFELDTQEIKEGGQMGFTTTLPGPLKAGRITLKNGLMIGSKMLEWYMEMLSGSFDEDSFRNVTVIVYKSGLPAYSFNFDKAFPVKWQGPALKAEDSAVVIESVELVYQGVTIV